MTTLVALVDGESTWLGADSQTTDQSGHRDIGVPKWHTRRGWAFGLSGPLRAHTILTRQLNLFDPAGPHDFVDWLADQLRRGGYRGERQGGMMRWNVSALLARAGALWEIDGHLAVREVRGFAAVGSGSAYAYGAAHVLGAGHGLAEPQGIVQGALRAACAFDTASGGPLFIARMGPEEVELIETGGVPRTLAAA